MDKEKKEKKEDKDKDDKEKKKAKRLEGSGFNAWDSTVSETVTAASEFTGPKAPQDKRDKERAKEKQAAKEGPSTMSASSLITDLLSKQKKEKDAKKEEEKKAAAEQARKEKREAEAQREQTEGFEVMEKGGLGNLMDKGEVMAVMKATVQDATSSAGRCQVSSRTLMGDKVYIDKAATFATLGDFSFIKGMVYIRGYFAEPGCKINLLRPSTLYACLSEMKGDDPYLGSWQMLGDDLALPEFEGNVPEIVDVRKKVFKDVNQRQVVIPKPPPGLQMVLIFVQPDFHADPFGDEEKEEDAEEKLARERSEAAAKRASKKGGAAAASGGGGGIKADNMTLDEQMQAILDKVEKGEKLSTKEKKQYERHMAKTTYRNEEEERDAKGGLQAFTLSLEGGKNDPPEAGDSFVCSNFTLSAPGQKLFDDASITITQGKRYGILGPNGMGKTTILRHIASRDMPVPKNWDVILVEQEAKASDRSAVDEVIASDTKTADLLVKEQSLLAKLEEFEQMADKGEDVPVDELEQTRDELEQVSIDLAASGADTAEAKVRKILCGLGFTNKAADEDRFSMNRPVVQFSGGWRMRISLAKALFLQPKLLMLDEPTNHLDLDAVLWLDHYLSEVYPHAIIVVSHDADFLDSICTDILHLEDKKLIHYRGDYTAFKKMHEQKRREMDSEYKKQQDAIKALKKKGVKQKDAEDQVKAQFKLESHEALMEKTKDYIVKFTFRGHGTDRTLGVNMSQVAFSYDGKEPWLLSDIEIGVDCGSRIAIVGPNGAGKSTLLNLMMQKLEPCEGDIYTSKGIRVGQYHQHFEELLPLDQTGIEYLGSAFNLSPPERARGVLGQFGLPGASHHTKIGNLSGGQKARVAFAALMLHEPHIIILDEPTNHLDIESVEALTSAIAKFNGGLVLVSHDARLITEVDCELWVVEDGTCYRFEKGFDGYRDKVLDTLQEREEEVERMEKKRLEDKQKARLKHVDAERMKKKQAELAASQAAEEKAKEKEKEKEKKKAEAAAAEDKKKAAKAKAAAPPDDEEDEDEDEEEEEEEDAVSEEAAGGPATAA
mmetsp:Transcript_51569/g.111995  ORF Transcript_51569/g.111995 Transcript_51569/m.111995 type:complete len:1059 (+) Transcript_51569:104-3280(+)